MIYLDGNSLGKLSNSVRKRINNTVIEEWGSRMIRSWNENWWEMPVRAASKISELIGAKEDEVIVCDSTSVNLYKLASSALKLNSDRKKVISEEINFPADLYVLQGIIDQMGNEHELVLAKSRDGLGVDYDEFERLIDKETALVVLTLVSYKSAHMYDMKRISDLAHKRGALVIWDLCHAVGAVPVDLNNCEADMAVGCTYKYLNCGPGSPAFLYVRKDLQSKLKSPIWGWFGEENPFAFNLKYTPSDSIRKFMTGTSGVLSMSAIEPSVEILLEAGMDNIREKSVAITDFFIRMFSDLLEGEGYILGSPSESNRRGSHISLRHPEAYRISKALIDPDCGQHIIIPDFRPPDNLRFGFAPLYNTFTETVIVVGELIRILKENEINTYTTDREDVT
jgi:kynureninase